MNQSNYTMKVSSLLPSQPRQRKKHCRLPVMLVLVFVAALTATQYGFFGPAMPLFDPTSIFKSISSFNNHRSPSQLVASGKQQSISRSTKTSHDQVPPLILMEKKFTSVNEKLSTRNKASSTRNTSNQGNVVLTAPSPAVKQTTSINSSSLSHAGVQKSLSLKETSSTSSGQIKQKLVSPLKASSSHGKEQQELSPAGKQNSFTNSTNQIKNTLLLPASRQVHAAEILQRMQRRGAMDSKMSSRDFVINHGFQRSWNPCVLECLFQAKPEKSINIVLIGGSSSARPGNTCNATTDGKLSGRYSDILQERLYTDTFAEANQGKSLFRIFNRAQGGTTSTCSALLLDSLVDPHTTDVLIWEFLINDDERGGIAEQVRKLDFWLTRVKALFAHVEKPPPAIIILCLWGRRALTTKLFTESASLDLNPLGYTGDLIDSYRKLNWDIAVLNVAAAVNMTQVVFDPKWLLDDWHHPACGGLGLIADMLQYALYSNLAKECSIDTAGHCGTRAAQQPSIPPHAITRGRYEQQWGQLWTDLFSEDSLIGSLSPWQPHIANATNLLVENLDHVWNWPKVLTGRALVGREDRKYAFHLPLCDKNSPLRFTLQDPNFKWLGLGSGKELVLSINNVTIPGSQSPWGGGFIKQWILLSEHVKKADKYTISLCSSRKIHDQFSILPLLVGVSVPVPNDSNV
jgi:hypothetical protein